MARAFHVIFPTFAKVLAEGYSRRQFRDGRLQLLSQLDKIHTNLPTQDVLACRPFCSYTMSLADPHLESDLSPLKIVFSRPRAKGAFRVPRRVPEHPAYRAFVDEHLALLPRLPEDPFGELRQRTMALQHAATCVLRLPASLHEATRPSWLSHWLFQGRSGWHRRDSSAVALVVRRLPDHRDLFMDAGGLLPVFPQESFAELFGGLMHTILMAELLDDV